MTNEELIVKIKAEIERRKMESIGFRNNEKREDWASFFNGEATALENLLSFLNTLESEKPMQEGLEEEMTAYIERHFHIRYDETLEVGNDPLTTYDFEEIARHFAKWGVEHLANNNMVAVKLGDEIAVNGYKLVYDKNENAIKVAKVEPSDNSEDLEEAAKKYQARIPVDTTIHYCGADEDVYFANHIVDAFIAGAKRDREQIMKNAVNATVHLEPGANPIVTIGVGRFGLKVRDKVKVIIVKED